MTPLEIIAAVRSVGGTVVVIGDDLAVEAPAGVLTQEHKAALAEHKAVLLQLLAPDDPERERSARAWVEALAPDEADAVLGVAIVEWDALVSQDRDLDAYVEAHGCYPPYGIGGWRSRWDDVEPDPAIVNAQWDDGLDPAECECEKCGSVMAWWDVGGRRHCQLCEPPIRWDMLKAMARRFRREGAVDERPVPRYKSPRMRANWQRGRIDEVGSRRAAIRFACDAEGKAGGQ